MAFQGVHGAHADLACRQAHPYMDTLPYASFEDVFDAVENGEAEYGMLPIENSQAGRVAEIHQLLPHKKVHIIGEYFQPIEHHLLAPKGTKLEDITDIYSHPQALMQCRQTIREINKSIITHSYSNTAVAAEDVSKWDESSKAAIASELASNLYNLDVIKSNIEDSKTNTTVFVTISKEPVDPDPEEGPVITSLLFTARNIPAALYKALGGFATNHVNLLKIESYIPGGVSQTAQFFISLIGHPSDKNVQLAIEELGFFCKNVKVLGIYHADKKRNL
ncbi:MAG: prephenate dehydratase [Rickettsiales bacterium]|nr:prephenate dehydratase [Rickettsiales bacterium]